MNPNKLKICVYAISKNEEKFVERFFKSAKDADLILLADTGSTDSTIKIARDLGILVHQISIKPWRFDSARNAALALIPGDYDVCISLDLDEVLEPGWREEIERVWTNATTRLRYPFDWGCNIRFMYEKIHHRTGYQWHHPCHEYPRPDLRITEVYAHTDKLLVSHYPDPEKSRGQYLDLLKIAVTEDPNCPRNAFYYARELTFYSHWVDAIIALNKYLEMPSANWINERCYAMRLLGNCYRQLGDNEKSLYWLRKACAEAPNTREPWYELAELCYTLSMWQECYSSCIRGLNIKEKELVYTCDPKVWGSAIPDLASIAAWNLDLKDVALDYAKQAVELDPENPRLVNNYNLLNTKT